MPALESHQRAGRAIAWLTGVFFTGLLVSGACFYHGRPFDWTAAIISDLQSPEENPEGYLPSAAATAWSGLFFFQLARVFHDWTRPASTALARAGSGFFGLGAAGALAIGCLAPFPVGYETVHVPLAFATFFFLVGGLGVYLFAAGLHLRRIEPARSLAAFGGAGAIVAILAALFRTYQFPDFFTGENLWRTLAFWEWLLCGSTVGFMLLLSWAYRPALPQRSPATRRSARAEQESTIVASETPFCLDRHSPLAQLCRRG